MHLIIIVTPALLIDVDSADYALIFNRWVSEQRPRCLDVKGHGGARKQCTTCAKVERLATDYVAPCKKGLCRASCFDARCVRVVVFLYLGLSSLACQPLAITSRWRVRGMTIPVVSMRVCKDIVHNKGSQRSQSVDDITRTFSCSCDVETRGLL